MQQQPAFKLDIMNGSNYSLGLFLLANLVNITCCNVLPCCDNSQHCGFLQASLNGLDSYPRELELKKIQALALLWEYFM